MLVICGTQRSGTTAVASLFAAEGFEIATQGRDEVGGYEHPIICNFYRRFLGDETFPYDDFPVAAGDWWHSHFASMEDKIVKFSYLLMNPVFVHLWHRIRPPEVGDKFLIMMRDAEAVCRSKEAHIKRFNHDSLLLQQPSNILRWNLNTSIRVLQQYAYPTAYLSFYDLTIQLEGLNKCLEKLDVPYRVSDETWKEVIDPSKVHY